MVSKRVEGVEYGDRWSLGIPHHPKSIEIYKRIEQLDFEIMNDSFGFSSGGDGDNGETLMYLFDVFFDEKDKENPK